MNKIEYSSELYPRCPICKKVFKVVEGNGYEYHFKAAREVKVFLCYGPLASDPLHYYSHIVDQTAPGILAYQEFSVDLGHKSILFANDYSKQQTLIRNQRNDAPLELSFLIVPDFPSLTSLKKRVRTAIVFS